MTRDPRRILFVSFDDPRDPRSWSGVPHSVLRALERRVERVDVLTGVPIVGRPVDRLINRLHGDRRYPLWLTKPVLRDFGRALERAVEDLRPDAVVAVSAPHLAHCRPELFDRVPVVMFCDGPWELWQEAYAAYTERRLLTRAYGRREAEVARRITATVYASEWATDWLATRHGVPRDKLLAVPFGPNLTPPVAPPPRSAPRGRIRLLFVGVDWRRKGGPFAVAVTRALRTLGRDAHLDIVGCTPMPAEIDPAFVEVHGVLSLHAPAERERLERLYGVADFLLVPTRAECFGIVFAEAGAFAVPAVAGDVHAVPSIIEDGINGLLVGERDDPDVVARRIADLVDDADGYARMSATARARCEERFGWDIFAGRLLEALDRGRPGIG